MKEFLKMVGATMVGILILFSIFCFFNIMIVASVFLASPSNIVEKNSVLHIRLSGMLEEQEKSSPLDFLFGKNMEEQASLDQIKKSISVAKKDDNIKGIYLDCGMMSGQYASLEEIRRALQDFKQSKKFVVSYGNMMSLGAYYVASVADKVYLNPSGMLFWDGLSANPVFFKGVLEKLGVEMQVFRVGKFKSAVEPFLLTQMSPENRSMMSSLLGSMWKYICQNVSKDRNIPKDSLLHFSQNYNELVDPKMYVEKHLIDGLLYIDQVRDSLRKMSMTDHLHFVDTQTLANNYKQEGNSSKIVVYVASGEIVDQDLPTSFDSSDKIVGTRIVDDLDKLQHDDNVKAVVLRVNSPGGSAFASEQIWRAVQLLKKEKPVVVSMGDYAASGGYYMSCGADYIVANPLTLTGSIGIFAMIPNANKLVEDKLGLHFDYVTTNNLPPFAKPSGEISPYGKGLMQSYVERGYRLFLSRVASGRKMRINQVDSIAQGRVWSGMQALNLKLVDKLGTLNDAIEIAVTKAKVKDYEIQYYGGKVNWWEALLDQSKSDYMSRKMKVVLGQYYTPFKMLNELSSQCSPLQARMTYDPNLK